MTSIEPDPRSRVLDLLRKHGWNTTSFQVLERGFSYWFDPASEGCVAYVDTGSAWVAAGAPIGPDIVGCGARFAAAARDAKRRACFFAVEERFAVANAQMQRMRIGEQPWWDPQTWPEILRRHRSLREQRRRAIAKGVTVRALGQGELGDPDSAVRTGVRALVDRWLAARRMPPMGFLVDVQLFDFEDEKRCFIAERDGRIVGLLVAVPIYRRQGWLFEDLLREPAAPNGTTELLIDAAMRSVAESGSRYATLGLAPLAGDVEPWLRIVRDSTRLLYDFDGVRRFRAKLDPAAWTPIYLAWPQGASGATAIVDALGAFTMRPTSQRPRASFVRFGMATLAHAPLLGVRVLAACLVPWTFALALAPATRFFPSQSVQYAWVIFDVFLGAGLLALASRWRSTLARALAFATTADALLTLLETLVDGPGRLHGLTDFVIAVVACTGPAVAASQLWGALAVRRNTSDA